MKLQMDYGDGRGKQKWETLEYEVCSNECFLGAAYPWDYRQFDKCAGTKWS